MPRAKNSEKTTVGRLLKIMSLIDQKDPVEAYSQLRELTANFTASRQAMDQNIRRAAEIYTCRGLSGPLKRVLKEVINHSDDPKKRIDHLISLLVGPRYRAAGRLLQLLLSDEK